MTKEGNEVLQHAPFFLINTFSQSQTGHQRVTVFACFMQDQGTREVNADLQYEQQGKRSDHSSPQLTLCGFFSASICLSSIPKILGFTCLLL